MKNAIRSSSAGDAVDTDAVEVGRHLREERRWAGEVLRRGVFELLYLASIFVILVGGLLCLYQLLTHKPALQTGVILMGVVGMSVFAYHFGRWGASEAMSRQVERLTAWLIATLGMALVWAAICFAFTFGALRWFSAPAAASWLIGGAAGLCGFLYMVAGEGGEFSACLAYPGAASQNEGADESIA